MTLGVLSNAALAYVEAVLSVNNLKRPEAMVAAPLGFRV